MRSHLFGIEALVREPNRLGKRGARWTRRRVAGRGDRHVADRGAGAPGPDAKVRRAAELSRTR